VPSSYLLVTEQQDEVSDADEGLKKDKLALLHAKLDRNGDGNIHVDELHAAHRIVFEADALAEAMDPGSVENLDIDNDGKLSVKELIEAVEEDEKSEWIEKSRLADVDGDGFLTSQQELLDIFHPHGNPEVFAVEVKYAFQKVDVDQDGKLTEEEYDASPYKMAPFEALDVSKDGTLSQDELAHGISGKASDELAFQELYELADEDGDGLLNMAELAGFANRTDVEDFGAWMIMDYIAEHDEL